ncbi:MAG: hypothetical protein OXF27_16195 [Acidobacteria bacterium]|nr:hypothetical protein [Acidobacteriota bacterium]
MEAQWWLALDKHRGSRPRCVMLVDGARHTVAARLTDLVNLPDVAVAPDDFWMPRGKPVKTSKGWDKGPAKEARIDLERDAGVSVPGRGGNSVFVAPELRRQLRDWWLEFKQGANTPNWDLASTCKIEGRDGLLLVEAKAHSNEFSNAGKPKPRSENGWSNHARIGLAIEQANAGLECVTARPWGLSRDSHYQLANRFAWTWKLARLGVPVVLIYLGFLNADDMQQDSAPFPTEGDWSRALKDHARGVVDASFWGKRLGVDGTPFRPLIRAIDLPFPPNP